MADSPISGLPPLGRPIDPTDRLAVDPLGGAPTSYILGSELTTPHPLAPPVFFDPSLMLESTGLAPVIFFIGSFQKSAQFIDGTGSGINWSMPSDFVLDSNVTVTLEWAPNTANEGDEDRNWSS